MLRVWSVFAVWVSLLGVSCAAGEKSDLQAYLDEIRFDTASHQKTMRKKISLQPCPELRSQVRSLDSEQE